MSEGMRELSGTTELARMTSWLSLDHEKKNIREILEVNVFENNRVVKFWNTIQYNNV